jgi:hypothetical protein
VRSVAIFGVCFAISFLRLLEGEGKLGSKEISPDEKRIGAHEVGWKIDWKEFGQEMGIIVVGKWCWMEYCI